ncbi:hypothetical protein B0T26DRAFT_751719 [Lasiosphaeria miniovina]|uniref:Uncharacterized protein n=1 Tax=Lasiosphaeria miniovina TaxID=1954250 RepID=A0AA40AL25_9PEZI|nr:uncharacterized protein B0T26DRAFT_751719 [Lasiosphaeria miniovina]KAK0717687.1 hypothetical protein B0T26DRAFT_751719 [Lasiosphaeria miniovina]
MGQRTTGPWQKKAIRTNSFEVTTTLDDYRGALEYAEALAYDCVQGMGIVAHHATIQESKKAMAEARGVTKLTRLVTLFVPLTFATSIFSINVREINANDGPPHLRLGRRLGPPRLRYLALLPLRNLPRLAPARGRSVWSRGQPYTKQAPDVELH